MVGKTPQINSKIGKLTSRELLGKPPLPPDDPNHTIISEQLPFETGDFTLAELLASIKSMSNHESCGLNEITTES